MYFTCKELIGIGGLPKTERGCRKALDKLATQNPMMRRKREGTKSFEYKLDNLPDEVQAAILIKITKETTADVVIEKRKEISEHEQCLSEVIWKSWDKATNKQRETAETRLQSVVVLAGLVEEGMNFTRALELAHKKTGQAKGSIKNWYYKAKNFQRQDWLVALLPSYGERQGKRAEFSDEAWDFFKADYYRLEKPEFGSCYQRLQMAAEKNGWAIPSVSSVKRKMAREVDEKLTVLWREGEHALSRMYPAMIRSVEDLEALEWINGDGYQHNVFVKWPTGDGEFEVLRPKTWFWQDIRTRKILAYRTDVSENSDTIRLSLFDVVHRYGIPKNITIDNTRAAANKWMTGRVKNRYRFKVKDDDPLGIIPALGIKLHWTSVQFGKGHGQAKPIERAFSKGGIGQKVDLNPRLAGFYAGPNVYEKPDNYQGTKAGVDYEEFILALEEGVQAYNNLEKRKTEICQGIFSFEQVWQRDYAKAHVKRATREYLRYMMLMAEVVTLKKDGTFNLNCGGTVNGRKNRYEAPELIGLKHKKVQVKFDPQNLHGIVFVYTLEGQFLAEALCSEKVAFGDKAQAREHDKYKKRMMKATKVAAKAEQKMVAQELQQFMPELEIDDEIHHSNIVELCFPDGNAMKKAQVVAEQELDDEEDEFEKFFQKGVELTKVK